MTKSVSKAWRLDLMKSLDRLRLDGRYTDVTLVFGPRRIKTHRLVLAAFSQNIEKQTDDIIELESTDDVNFDECITFLYDLKYITVKSFKKELQVLGKSLGIKFLTDIKTQLFKDDIVFNDKLQAGWLDQAFGFFSKSLLSGFLCDVVIRVEGEAFKCHKLILSAVSPFFDSMFLSGMRETSAPEVPLLGVNKTAFRKVLSFIYSGQDIVTSGSVELIMTTSVYLQISKLQERCEKYLMRHMDCENAIGVNRLGKMCDSVFVKDKSLKYILNNFIKISNNVEFYSLSLCEFIQFLKDDRLTVQDETLLFDATVRWFESQNRESTAFYKLLTCIKLANVDRDHLSTVLRTGKVLQRSPESKTLIKKTLVDLAEGRLIPTTSTSKFDEVLIVERSSGYNKGILMACYSFVENKWYELAHHASYDAGCAYAACSSNNKIYVSGGSGNLHGFCRYDIETNKWRDLPALPGERSEHVAVAMDTNVFILGGRNHLHFINSGIERFNTTQKKWEKIGNLQLPVFGASGLAMGDKIYVVGGCLSFSEYSDAIQSFDTVTQTCSVIARLPIQCSFADITCHEDFLYIVGPRGHVMLFDQDSNPEMLGNIHNSSCMGFSATYYNGEILVAGGYAAKSETMEVRSFDLNKRKASTLMRKRKMPWKKESFQYFSVISKINKQFLVNEIKDCK